MATENSKTLLKMYREIMEALRKEHFSEFGDIKHIPEDDDINILKLSVSPHDGVHKERPYVMTIKFREKEEWPLVYIDSEIYDKIKTNQYLRGQGYAGGEHKGICIKYITNGYSFKKNFKEICKDKWDIYISLLICTFNNLQDFEKGNGIKSTYKNILGI